MTQPNLCLFENVVDMMRLKPTALVGMASLTHGSRNAKSVGSSYIPPFPFYCPRTVVIHCYQNVHLSVCLSLCLPNRFVISKDTLQAHHTTEG